MYFVKRLTNTRPKLDGFGACSAMRVIEKETPARGASKVIAVTALSGAADRQRGLEQVGMDTWLTKPINKPALFQIIQDAHRAVQDGRAI